MWKETRIQELSWFGFFFQIDSYKLLKPFMQANNLTKAPRSEIERQGMTDAHHQQALGQG